MHRQIRAAAAAIAIALPLSAQQQPGPVTDTAVARLVVEPPSLVARAGETVPIRVTAYDDKGNVLRAARIRLSGPRAAVAVSDSLVKALRAGRYEIVATAGGRSDPVIVRIPIAITWPSVTRVVITPEPGKLYTGVTLAHTADAFHRDSSERTEAVVTWTSSRPVPW
jgi:hypothetical protein